MVVVSVVQEQERSFFISPMLLFTWESVDFVPERFGWNVIFGGSIRAFLSVRDGSTDSNVEKGIQRVSTYQKE